MNLAVALFLGYVFHRVGDYLTQNDWMANEKTKRFLPALIHALIYSIPFIFLDLGFWWFGVFVTHFLIDRYRLAVWWIKLVNWNWESTNFGYDEQKPKWMSVWLMINVDNTWHLLINTFCILMAYTQ